MNTLFFVHAAKALGELRRVLEPGGRLVIHTVAPQPRRKILPGPVARRMRFHTDDEPHAARVRRIRGDSPHPHRRRLPARQRSPSRRYLRQHRHRTRRTTSRRLARIGPRLLQRFQEDGSARLRGSWGASAARLRRGRQAIGASARITPTVRDPVRVAGYVLLALPCRSLCSLCSPMGGSGAREAG
ncbi:hypothetical protein [Nocardia nepalensis]|uniref:hypothetical protein n=1 Tax=Nocardia nepalensis TaxID=3375448 RepID=UPI003B6835D7